MLDCVVCILTNLNILLSSHAYTHTHTRTHTPHTHARTHTYIYILWWCNDILHRLIFCTIIHHSIWKLCHIWVILYLLWTLTFWTIHRKIWNANQVTTVHAEIQIWRNISIFNDDPEFRHISATGLYMDTILIRPYRWNNSNQNDVWDRGLAGFIPYLIGLIIIYCSPNCTRALLALAVALTTKAKSYNQERIRFPDSSVGWPNVVTVVLALAQRWPDQRCCLNYITYHIEGRISCQASAYPHW